MMKLPFIVVSLSASTLLAAARLEAAGPDEPQRSPSRASSAASAEPKGYLQSGLMVTAQPAGIPNHRVTPAISGTAVGLAAAVGFFLTPTLAIEGEVVGGGAISTPQRFSYNWREDYIGENRDVFLGANVRWRPATRPLEFVGGAGLAVNTVASRSIVVTDVFAIPPRPPRTEPDEVMTSRQFALNGGVATPLRVSRRIEVVPAFRVRWVKRSSSFYGLGAYAGVGSYAYQFGATVRWTFD
jgi:hypothetical protein